MFASWQLLTDLLAIQGKAECGPGRLGSSAEAQRQRSVPGVCFCTEASKGQQHFAATARGSGHSKSRAQVLGLPRMLRPCLEVQDGDCGHSL